jgi:hypothetical protein
VANADYPFELETRFDGDETYTIQSILNPKNPSTGKLVFTIHAQSAVSDFELSVTVLPWCVPFHCRPQSRVPSSSTPKRLLPTVSGFALQSF